MAEAKFDVLAFELWDQAGERPYEVLKEEGLYDDFMKALNSTSYNLQFPLYRGTIRHSEKVVGDVIDYVEPSSWSSNPENASRFILEAENPVLLQLVTQGLVKAVENPKNTYGEEEFILYPCQLQIVSKHIEEMSTIFDVVIIDYY